MTTFREYRAAQLHGFVADRNVPALPTDAVRFQGERAGLVSRAVAAIIDVVLIFAAVLATIAALWMLSFIIDPTNTGNLTASVEAAADRQTRIPPAVAMVAYGYVLNVLYWTAFWALSGRTVGNLVMGLRVVNRKGAHPGWFLSLARALFCTIFPIGLIWVALSRRNRSVQDMVLRTSVIYDWVVGIPWLKQGDGAEDLRAERGGNGDEAHT
ncbi:MAG: RDD family protein [Candidatus Nanopelagicales bacterium]